MISQLVTLVSPDSQSCLIDNGVLLPEHIPVNMFRNNMFCGTQTPPTYLLAHHSGTTLIITDQTIPRGC